MLLTHTLEHYMAKFSQRLWAMSEEKILAKLNDHLAADRVINNDIETKFFTNWSYQQVNLYIRHKPQHVSCTQDLHQMELHSHHCSHSTKKQYTIIALHTSDIILNSLICPLYYKNGFYIGLLQISTARSHKFPLSINLKIT